MARVEYHADYPGSASAVLAVLTDQDFLDEYAREIGALRWSAASTVVAGAPVTQLDFTVPTGGVPAVFRRFVGASIDVSDHRTWMPPDGQGVHRAALLVETGLGSRHARVRGSIVLASQPSGVRFSACGDVEVVAPPVSRLAATQIASVIRTVLERESVVVRRRLPGGAF